MDFLKNNVIFNQIENIFAKVGLGRDGPVEKILNIELIKILIVLFQGCYGGLGIVQVPKILTKVLNDLHEYISPAIRFIFILSISYTATQHIGISIITTFIFLCLLFIFRTQEERNQMPKCGSWKCIY
tara:strand:- start:20 stop:403 length:384 start_codon:yes stop_codon:yes gene_type:complete